MIGQDNELLHFVTIFLSLGTEMSPATIRGMLWAQGMIVPVYIIIITVSVLVDRFLASTLIVNETNKKMHKQAVKVGEIDAEVDAVPILGKQVAIRQVYGNLRGVDG